MQIGESVTPAKIVGDMKSCLSATTETSVETGKLEMDVWRHATIKADRKDEDLSLEFFGKGDFQLITDRIPKRLAQAICAPIAELASATAEIDMNE